MFRFSKVKISNLLVKLMKHLGMLGTVKFENLEYFHVKPCLFNALQNSIRFSLLKYQWKSFFKYIF